MAGDDFHKILLSNQSVGSGGRILPRKPARNSFGISFRAIGQKVGLYREEGISEETRENRITAIGNDLYSANSRSFLNPFLGILRRAPLPSRKGDAASRILFFIYLIDCPRNLFQLLSPSFLYFQSFRPSFLASLSLYLSLETVRKVSRALHVSASGNCPVSQIMLVLHPFPFPPFLSPPSRFRVTTRANTKVWRQLCTSVTRCADTSHSYVTTREKAFS